MTEVCRNHVSLYTIPLPAYNHPMTFDLDIVFNSIGIAGVACILLAYFLITLGKLTGGRLAYHILNLIGAAMLLASLFWKWNLPSVVIEVCWIAISLFGIWKVRRTL